MEELATVVAINPISKNCSKITVASQIKSTCSSCNQVDSCGSGLVSKAFPQKKLVVELTTKLEVSIGDVIVLGINERGLLQTAWQVYLWPLIGLILFSGLGQYLINQGIFSNEIYGILLGGAGGYLGHRLAKFWQTYSQSSLALMPKLLRVKEKALEITPIN